jgi:DNA repair exonuclease SbcCD ATPase subunit
VIVFKKLTFKNFLSVGNAPVTIDLNASKTTLVFGTNGSGKSSILDAICYALFNKPFRKINLPQLLNSQNKKGLLAEVEFSIGKTDYVVARGMKPKVFTVMRNGEEIDAKAADKDNQAHLEQNILKLTFKSFCQVVILGSSNYIPFMQLTGQARRDCVEDFLDIKVFSTMSVIAKERMRGLRDQINTRKGDISNLEYKMDLQKDRIKELESQSKSDLKELEDIVTSRRKKIDSLTKSIESAQLNESAVMALVDNLQAGKPTTKLAEFNKVIIKMENKLERLHKDLKFYKDHDNCPTCDQHIPMEVKKVRSKATVDESQKYKDALQSAAEELDKYEYLCRILTQRQKHIESLQKSIFKYQTEVNSLQSEVNTAEDKIFKLQEESGSIDREQGKLDLLTDDLREEKTRYEELIDKAKDHELVVNLLKDSGIKTQIVKKYIPVMNNCIRRNLQELELPVHFMLDEEFNETVSSPMYQDFSYASFSEGQKARIDLALMLTWREVGKIKNSVSTNLLILDEVFSGSLDEVGKDCLLKILRYKLDDNQRVIVVDHTLSSEFKDKFDRNIEVQRVNGFSSYS